MSLLSFSLVSFLSVRKQLEKMVYSLSEHLIKYLSPTLHHIAMMALLLKSSYLTASKEYLIERPKRCLESADSLLHNWMRKRSISQ